MRTWSINSALFLACMLQHSVVAQSSFEVLKCDPDGFDTYAADVSANGAIAVGRAYISGPFGLDAAAIRWASHGWKSLGSLGGNDSRAQGISPEGDVIVGTSDTEDGSEAFRWTAHDGMISLGRFPPDDGDSAGYEVSSGGGVIVGFGYAPDSRQAFRWTMAEGLVGLGLMPDGSNTRAVSVSGDGAVLAGSASGPHEEAIRWTGPDGFLGLGTLPGYTGSRANAVSRDGTTIVGMAFSGQSWAAFRWNEAEKMIALADPPNAESPSQAFAVNDDGSVIVGSGKFPGRGAEAAIWTSAGGMQAISTILIQQGVTEVLGWYLKEAVAVSADGRVIVGNATSPDGTELAWKAVVALPHCYGDQSGDGVLDLFDFLVYINLFNSGDPRADCDADGFLDLFDFLCFVNTFNAAC